MRNPYEVLEISNNASEEEIKAAYKGLVKKYHPDQYSNNPLSDLAEEKLKEINEAYDTLMKNKGSAGYSSQSSGRNQQYSNGQGSTDYNQIRNMIQRGDINGAEQKLDSITTKNAEWNFLKGIIFQRKGWYDQAQQHLQLAVSMDPSNQEYRSSLNNMGYRNNSYRDVGSGSGYGNNSLCDTCSCMLCSDCCCESLGGDLISCC